MGTRSLSMCKQGGEMKIFQYGQWDGYFEGQGATILEFCRDADKIAKLRAVAPLIRDLYELEDYVEEHDSLCPSRQQDHRDHRTKKMLYHDERLISRDVAGEIFDNIISIDTDMLPEEMNRQIYLVKYKPDEKNPLSKNFSNIWIEFAYCINLDDNTFDIYTANHLFKRYPLDALPETNKQFFEEMETIYKQFFPEG